MFYDKKCTIKSVTYTNVDGVEKRDYTALYTNIDCNFDKKSRRIVDTENSSNSFITTYIVSLPITYSAVRENMLIELIDPVLGSLGDHIIESAQADPSIGGDIDCITLTCVPMKGQL